MLRLALLSLVLLSAATGAAAAGGGGLPPAPAIVVAGYPYAASCPFAGYADAVDRWGMYQCNCTSFAAWALQRNGQRTAWFIEGEMDAWNWPNVARESGFRIGRAARAGALAVWPHVDPPYGHVAYVTNVDGGGRFDVAEYNLLIPYGFDSRVGLSPAGVTFVYVPRRVPRR